MPIIGRVEPKGLVEVEQPTAEMTEAEHEAATAAAHAEVVTDNAGVHRHHPD